MFDRPLSCRLQKEISLKLLAHPVGSKEKGTHIVLHGYMYSIVLTIVSVTTYLDLKNKPDFWQHLVFKILKLLSSSFPPITKFFPAEEKIPPFYGVPPVLGQILE